MGKLNRYREVVRRLVEGYANEKPSDGDVDSYSMMDAERDHYIAMQTGWVNGHRVHGAFLHIDIIDEKVWIQFNGTDQSIAAELVEAGIPKEDIILGEKPAEIRQYTGYGVA